MPTIKSAAPRKRATGKTRINSDERERRRRERAFLKANRALFSNAGFRQIAAVDGKHFTFDGVKSEIDDVFIYENVILIVEYTTARGANLADHAKGKSGSHNKIAERPLDFLTNVLSPLVPEMGIFLSTTSYTSRELQVRLVYVSDQAVEDHHQSFFRSTFFMARREREYFRKLSKTIKLSSRFEMFEFFDILSDSVGKNGVIAASSGDDRYSGLILPEEQSNFPSGFKVVSFYVDPQAILSRAYILRQNGWRQSENLYQRMILPKKIESIRRHLREKKRVFANNVVLTLPDDAEFRRIENDAPIQSLDGFTKPQPIKVCLKKRSNSVGIVDGQHRVFSYYEGLDPDHLIDRYRGQQNLLATGIVYPIGKSLAEKQRFEADLFLEINATQSGANSQLKQAIWSMLDPFRPVSVARSVVNRLAATAPLNGILERNVYDEGKIPTTSIVAYGMMPLLKRSGRDSIFGIWTDPDKANLFMNQDADALNRYVEFATAAIAGFFEDIKRSLPASYWRVSTRTGDGILSVTTINSFAILLRKLIGADIITGPSSSLNLSKLKEVDFRSYRSSQYAKLADRMFSIIA